jgi:prolyl-tRNA editing enzyme YbaK/EbsC (Cys-tRNA(Pro) deacylase)
MYVSGGRRGLDVGVTPVDLIRLLAAITGPIAT